MLFSLLSGRLLEDVGADDDTIGKESIIFFKHITKLKTLCLVRTGMGSFRKQIEERKVIFFIFFDDS